jgi:hypothetical protein
MTERRPNLMKRARTFLTLMAPAVFIGLGIATLSLAPALAEEGPGISNPVRPHPPRPTPSNCGEWILSERFSHPIVVEAGYLNSRFQQIPENERCSPSPYWETVCFTCPPNTSRPRLRHKEMNDTDSSYSAMSRIQADEGNSPLEIESPFGVVMNTEEQSGRKTWEHVLTYIPPEDGIPDGGRILEVRWKVKIQTAHLISTRPGCSDHGGCATTQGSARFTLTHDLGLIPFDYDDGRVTSATLQTMVERCDASTGNEGVSFHLGLVPPNAGITIQSGGIAQTLHTHNATPFAIVEGWERYCLPSQSEPLSRSITLSASAYVHSRLMNGSWADVESSMVLQNFEVELMGGCVDCASYCPIDILPH